MSATENLAKLGLALPPAPEPIGSRLDTYTVKRSIIPKRPLRAEELAQHLGAFFSQNPAGNLDAVI